MKYKEGITKIKNETVTVTDLGGIGGKSGEKGGLRFCENLLSDGQRSLSVRGRRAVIRELGSLDGIFADDTLVYADSGRLFYGGLQVDGIYLTGGDKRILKHGKYVIVFPDEIYYNTADPSDYGSLSVSYSFDTGVYACCVNGQLEEISYSVLGKVPDGAESGDYCAVRTTDGSLTMKRYDGSSWIPEQCYIKVYAPSIGKSFRVGDTVECRGLEKAVGGAFKIIAKQDNALFCEGILEARVDATGQFSATRDFPKLDFVTVSGGRIWGVRRGRDNFGSLVSRIYASSEGDPFNFSELSGGMYCDIDVCGAFTGICDYLSSPIAFTESEIIEVLVKNGRLIPTVIKGYGVETGADNSIVCEQGKLYYKSGVGVCRYDGSYPERISPEVEYALKITPTGAPAVAVSGRYYVKLSDGLSDSALYVYDIEHGKWYRENDIGVKAFAKRHENAYALFDNGEARGIMLMNYDEAHENERCYCCAQGYPLVEDEIKWSFQSQSLWADELSAILPIRLAVRMKKPQESSVRVGMIYDGEVRPSDVTEISRGTDGAVNVPVKSKRCDTARLFIEGQGQFKLLGYALTYRSGGESRAWK